MRNCQNPLSEKSCREADDSFFREPPASTIGILKLHGFLFVGKAGICSRMDGIGKVNYK